MEKLKKVIAAILCILLVLSLAFSISFVSHGASHDCVGEDCRICAVINKCAELLRDLLTFGACAAIFGIFVYSVRNVVSDSGVSYTFSTPVRLKVKITN